ncbi:MAG: tetrathionate reductase family octaheme c-type cytochrome, partial [Desulfobulbales bacterium]|nr:tetrathionate reductase family octaheme c-type cytochrome [Desulfobulbales bacterium]
MKRTIITAAALVLAAFAFKPLAFGAPEHQNISGPFESPMEVTRKCIECHDQAAHDIMQTSHWTWKLSQDLNEKGTVDRGKMNTINNFCISINGNWARCTSCHIGYGWRGAEFDFSDPSRIDCLVCHDKTGSYKKPGPAAGMPAGFTGIKKFDEKPVNLVAVAQNVGIPARDNCIVCHGFGGGGNNVKHGDIDSSMKKPLQDHDVHMGSNGQDFSCQECHATENHMIKGNAMVVSPRGENHVGCTDCHDEKLHNESLLNQHTARIACQTCHIPYIAKEMPTKLAWDWSSAGEDIVDPPKDEFGMPIYNKKKGSFVWGKNVVPTYAWYNGKAGAYLVGAKIDPGSVTKLSYPLGNIGDGDAKIYPFKVHAGKQIYDKKYNYLITPKLFGSKNDPDAYWVKYDWDKAAAAGMKLTGLPYSGEYGFAP